MAESFFEESLEQSRIKSRIVAKYFWAWAQVIKQAAERVHGKLAYIDLFCGPGRYSDGTKSTPIMVLERAVQDPDMCRLLVTIFNDANTEFASSLSHEIEQLPGIGKLKFKPEILNQAIGNEICDHFETTKVVPTFFFVDPWGYKGLSLRLIGSIIKDWGCDCVFFFNYNRINMGFGNKIVEEHLNELFGKERADALRARLEPLSPLQRELMIVEELANALREKGAEFVLPFTFRDETGRRTKHHLIFVTKHVRGYEIMKDIMAKESSSAEQGVPTFAYNPADISTPMLFELSRPLDELEELLLRDFAGRTLSMIQVYDAHHIGRRYIASNYKEALRQLELKGKVIAEPKKRRVVKRVKTFGDDVLVTFPERKGS